MQSKWEMDYGELDFKKLDLKKETLSQVSKNIESSPNCENDKVYPITHCRLCDSMRLKKVISLAKNPIGDQFFRDRAVALSRPIHSVEVMLCKDCGQMQLSEVIEPAQIYRDEYLYITSSSVGLSEHFAKLAQELFSRFELKSGDFVVEIGCNEGAVISEFKKLGARVLGIDPATRAIEVAKKRGLECINDFFNEKLALQIKKKFGLANNVIANNVIANNVIANIPALREILSGIKILLAPRGVFVFETSYAHSVLKRHLIDTIYHEHISYFSCAPLCRLFASLGLEIFDAEEINTKGGSLRLFVSHSGAFAKTSRLCEILKNEDELIFASHIVANARNLERLFSEISTLLGDCIESSSQAQTSSESEPQSSEAKNPQKTNQKQDSIESKSGTFVFESFYALDVFSQNLIDMVFLEHINYLYLTPLMPFLEQRGLFIFHARRIKSKGGSIQIHISKEKKEPSTELLELLAQEQKFFKKDDIFINFAKNLNKFASSVKQAAKAAQDECGGLFVYGASVGCVMMAIELGIISEITAFLDDNPIKIGAFCPSFGTPVLDSSILERGANAEEIALLIESSAIKSDSIKQGYKPKIVISLAWRFMQPICARHSEFLANGGEFWSINLAELNIKKY